MKRSIRMKVVVDLAQRQEDAAAKQFKQCQEALQQELQRLDELKTYYDDYEAKFNSKTGGLRANEIADSRLFLQRLNDAQSAQQLNIQRIKAEFDRAKLIWHQAHLKRQNLCDLVVRYREEEQLDQDRLEQKGLDDWTSIRSGQSD